MLALLQRCDNPTSWHIQPSPAATLEQAKELFEFHAARRLAILCGHHKPGKLRKEIVRSIDLTQGGGLAVCHAFVGGKALEHTISSPLRPMP
jgi:hypothetical protein